MKFGKYLQANMPQEWRFHFIDYIGLKKYLKETVADPGWNEEKEAKFTATLEDELKKVSDFGYVKYNELARHIQFIESAVSKQVDTLSDAEKEELKQELDHITGEIAKLAKFNTLNYTAFVKILKKHDKLTGFKLKYTFLAILSKQPFYKETFDGMITTLSSLYDRLKPADRADVKGTVNLQRFVRHTTKYWVHSDNITAVKCIIMQHLPVLVFKKNPTMSRGYDAAISSVYYDNSHLDLYHERIEKVEKALALRMRWYGSKAKEVFVERKTHHEDWTGDASVKERFSLKEKHVNAFCRGEYKLDSKVDKMRANGKSESEISYVLNLAREIQEQIASYGLQPCVRTFYNRTAFQHPTSQTVRISLDTELTMIREMDRSFGNWYRTEVGVDWPFDYLAANELSHFPYAILEVKLQTAAGDQPPAWITELTNSNLVEMVPKFSKFIHGCASLLENRVRLLPYWMPQMDKDIRRPANDGTAQASAANGSGAAGRSGYRAITMDSLATFESSLDPAEPTETTSLLGRSTARAPPAKPQPQKAIQIPIRVEPKVIFANERTFLNWLNIAVVISAMGLALLDIAPKGRAGRASHIAGLTLVPVSLAFMGYALYIYFWRDRMIRRRSGQPYNTVYGPLAITTAFLLALATNYLVWFAENGLDSSKW